ncbi:nitroreductase family deazaflavin-dependent oxidoreductase [Tsukamurella sputi]|uniref:Nitroreductase family deazaflavin-dependent oxidoreductase n=1 Tax=Tsukamurella sputi TaxID=2591848 RepID=A0A5C5RS78_9ACTN|nr:nitroreductase family deazaflavin-dependent oxidoreductase [Tsukamurella sputi]TWS25917.1 nitroreductase family deazaflavin-dependent oxidoreductase [Tsukamurella sputi]
MRVLSVVVGAVVLVPLAAIAVILAGIRFRVRPILDVVRRINRDFTNPRAVRDAESPDSTRTVVRHMGRRSGTAYETPVDAFATDRGALIIALPYGPVTDWVRNVRAAGTVDLLRQGSTLTATEPRIVATADILEEIPAGARRTLRLFGVEQCLELRVS